ncbi:unnamed protein product [Discosporangium mesarthrocarpum]
MGRLKWGKKGHKVENKNPYEESGLGSSSVQFGARVSRGGKRGKRGKKLDDFTRVTLPHHPSYQGPEGV